MAVVQRRMGALLVMSCLVSVAAGGEIKLYSWPETYAAQEFCDIGVFMDIEIVPSCTITPTPVKLQPVGVATFEGCSSLLVQCNFNLTLSSSIVPTGVVQGRYSASLSERDIDAPGGTTQLCVRLEDALPGGQAGTKGVQVAVVKITVAPRP